MNLNVKIVDKGALRSAIAAVSEKNYQSSNYTEDTYTAFYLALVDANKILGDFKSTQEQIDAAKTKLESAANALKYADADYTALDAAVERADQILNDEGSADIYTQESLEALKAARDAAVALKTLLWISPIRPRWMALSAPWKSARFHDGLRRLLQG